MDFKDYVRALGDLILPRNCTVCGSPLAIGERQLCGDCLSDIPLTYHWALPHNAMADRYNGLIQRDLDAAAGKDLDAAFVEGDGGGTAGSGGKALAYQYAAALFFYRSGSGYRNITRSLKYGGNIEMGRIAARMLGERITGTREFCDVDAVVPVPLHWTRRLSRGYNQAEVIAEELASVLGVPCIAGLLERTRRTRTQTKLGIGAKGRNVEGAFRVNGKTAGRVACGRETGGADIGSGRFRHILVVDDVFTTGATVNECRRALWRALGSGVRVSVATLGFVGE